MCGIVGFAGSNFAEKELQQMIRMASRKLHHRGPDEEGDFCAEGIALGISRLAIRDPTKGQQPMTRNGMTIVFNGELYETEPLKTELKKRGHLFETDSDTEVFLLAFIEYGPTMLVNAVGMFAFAIWDSEKKILYLGRDRWGEKPLYYTCGNNFIAFASEIKALRLFPNIQWEIAIKDLAMFLKYSYIPAPNTGWTNIFKLKPGSFLTWHQGTISKKSYLNSFPNCSYNNYSSLEQAEELLSLLNSSVKACLVSDRPLGAFLSGGLDSTAISYLLSRYISAPPVFSLLWDEPDHSEELYVKEASLAFGLKLQSIKCDAHFFQSHFDQLVQLYDEPFADESMVPTYCLAKFAKQYVDVVLTGDGADEFFHGYERYFFQGSLQTYFELFSAMSREIKELICENELLQIEKNEQLTIILEKGDGLNSQRLRSWIDIQTYLPDDILTKVDRATMAVGLEARAPFLTPQVTNFALNCSHQQLIGHRQRGKEILRLAMRNHLPKIILNRKKMGFGVPIANWFRTVLKEWMMNRLVNGALIHTHWFSKEGINRLIHFHLSGHANHSRALLNLLVLEAWLRK